jgi:hypothetical protein
VTETRQALEPLINALQSLDISYRVVGSVASSVQGLVRATLDVDMVANLQAQHIPTLTAQLKDSYYLDPEMMTEAVQRGSSFNLIHLETMIKIDVFILGKRDYDRISFERERLETLDDLQLSFKTPEDIILGKLEWFEKTDRTSDRQWRDIVGLMKTRDDLDSGYLRQWASDLGVLGLLEKASRESHE